MPIAAKHKYDWHKVTKHYKGGVSEFQIRLPSGVKLSKDDWECVLEWLGENTDGGHAYGYSMQTRKLKAQSPSLKVVKYPAGLCAKLMDYSNDVTTTTSMI